MSLVRSVIEHGNEIWGDREMVDFEKLLQMGKRKLRCGSGSCERRAGVGETKSESRRDEAEILGRIIRMSDDRIVKRIYRESKNRLEREEEEAKQRRSNKNKQRNIMIRKAVFEEFF